MYAGLVVGVVAALLAIREATSPSSDSSAVVAMAAGSFVGFFIFLSVRNERSRSAKNEEP
jgi:xanthosine utilization system XapX-like protein